MRRTPVVLIALGISLAITGCTLNVTTQPQKGADSTTDTGKPAATQE